MEPHVCTKWNCVFCGANFFDSIQFERHVIENHATDFETAEVEHPEWVGAWGAQVAQNASQARLISDLRIAIADIALQVDGAARPPAANQLTTGLVDSIEKACVLAQLPSKGARDERRDRWMNKQ